MDSTIKYLIIGAGPTGLGAAYQMGMQNQNDFLVIEKAPQVGGLSSSFVDNKGFTWDIGGHVLFSHFAYFDQALLKAIHADQWLTHKRQAWIWKSKRFIPYPFQNNIHYLPSQQFQLCLDGLEQVTNSNSKNESTANFEDWIYNRFGKAIAESFMIPYNCKVWKCHPREMNYSWVADRVSVIDLEQIKKNFATSKSDSSWGPNSTFLFPKNGGTGYIWNSFFKLIGCDFFKINNEVIHIDAAKKQVTLGSGEKIFYRYLLNTMPLQELAEKTDSHSLNFLKDAHRLKYSATYIVGIGIHGKIPDTLKTKCWIYFPENDCPFYRVTVFSNYSPNNVPDIKNQYSLMVEVSEAPEKKVITDTLVEEVLNGLMATKLIDESTKIITTWTYCAPFGYPIPTLDRDEILKSIIPNLEKMDIYSRGRFGGHKYEVGNQDHSFMQGVEWADKILNGTAESTYIA
ncbi:MAG: NAD(P)-binding protein [Bacteriovoracaceae bacterium]|nr:NAD(P)-binding protein [Bacteriovoracaceae bacterium]